MAINITLEQVKALLKIANQTIVDEKRSGNNLGTVLKLSNGCIINCWDKGTANCQVLQVHFAERVVFQTIPPLI